MRSVPNVRLDLLAQDVKRHRGERSQRDLGRELELSAATLCRVEAGRGTDLETFSKLCGWLGRDPALYLGLADAPPPARRCGRCDRIRHILVSG
jgi:hypothetical protein